MKYAIDRYNIGIEQEVSADDFDGQYYIPGRRNRFFCPECGEIVYFRAKGGNNPSHFYHQEKTDRTPECDKRVDGRSSLSLNERVGLPIYLTTFSPGTFQISIGFPAIGSEMLKNAASANCIVEISSGNQYRTVKVSTTNFIQDEISLIPVNFIPKNGRNYIITVSGDRTIYGLHRKWSDYADGFSQGGAIFTYEDSSGKKIRRGDSISTHREYYVVTRNALPNYANIIQECVGKLNIGHEIFKVFRVSIVVSIEDKNAFLTISNYLQSTFGVWLLECIPEIVPIWPPVIEHGSLTPVSGITNIVCAISSGNRLPNVYVYSEYGVSKKEINHDYNGVKTVEIIAGKRPITLSVDRKYVGREISFLSQHILDSSYNYEIAVGNQQGTVPWASVNEKVLSSEFKFFSNSKMELYTGINGKMFRHIPIRDEITKIPAMANTKELYLVVGSNVIQRVRCINEIKDNINDEYLFQQLQRSVRGQLVPIPRWADYVIRSLKKSHSTALFDLVMSTIKNGQIPIGVLGVLRTIKIKR